MHLSPTSTVNRNRALAEIERRRRHAERTAILVLPADRWELQTLVRDLTGITLASRSVCKEHDAPLDAFAAAYFGEAPVIVWEASRGFGGKSVMLAALSFIEATVLGASVNLLGGSGEQSQRVHDYMTGEETNLPGRFWLYTNAPRHLLLGDTTKRRTRLTNGGQIRVLMASQTSIRGGHPQRLRIDECDEMDLSLLDASLGQPMEARGIREQTVLSSTHHNPAGTMTEIKRRAAENAWKSFTWCYKESMQSHDGWLSAGQVERKRETVTSAMWLVEYELQEPSPESRAIIPEKVELMFDESLGVYDGFNREYIELEAPQPAGVYVTGADWAKKQDKTCIITFRVLGDELQLVAFEQMNRLPWPYMIGRFDKRIERYPGEAAHDATGVGDVVEDFVDMAEMAQDDLVQPVVMVGRRRRDLLTEYIAAIENDKVKAPKIKYMYNEHKYADVDALFGQGHLPDTISAGSLALWAHRHPANQLKEAWSSSR